MSSSDLVVNAAHALAVASTHVEKASENFAATVERRDLVQERIDALTRGRQQIIGRRQAGDQHPDDGASLALIAADLEGLAPMLLDAEAITSDAKERCTAAQAAVRIAEQTLEGIEAFEAETALIAHASRLDQLLLETVRRFNAVRQRIGSGTPKWGPSPALALELRKLQAARREL